MSRRVGDCAAPKLMRWIDGLEGLYLVHRDGYVLNRRAQRISTTIDRYGYVTVRIIRNGKRRIYKVHRLVCAAFHGAPTAAHCAHNDGNKLNNAADNLRWASHAENTADAIKHGTHSPPPLRSVHGEAHPQSKLTEAQCAAIRKRRVEGEEGKALAAEYGVHPATISRIATGKRWSATHEPSQSSLSRPLSRRPSTIAGRPA